MKNLLLIASVFTLAISCEKKLDQTINTETTAPDSITIPENAEPIESSTVQTCYVANTGKDSVFVSLDDNLGTFSGKMKYKNFEKDSSSGDLIGTKNGDTLKLIYTFASEGNTSEREINFLVKDGNLVEGIGEHKTENRNELYANPAQLKYTGQILKKTDCSNFDKNFMVK